MLSNNLVQRVIGRMGVSAPVSPTLEGLAPLYAAWCAWVPFDNVRKLIALQGQDQEFLPGMEADEFFEAWLAHGCGATCWPSAQAWFALLSALGFDCWRVAGSMRDCQRINHGSVVVQHEERRWLVDTSMLTHVPLPLGYPLWQGAHPVHDQEVEADGDAHVVWSHFAPTGFLPCRVFPGVLSWAQCRQHYEASRAASPFNRRVYARRVLADEVRVLSGTHYYVRDKSGLACTSLSADEVLACLQEVFGVSQTLRDAWVACGGATLNQELLTTAEPPPVVGVRPSQRR